MLEPTNKHGSRTPRKGAVAARLFAAVLIAVVGLAPLSASWHEASFRHVQCAEHGQAIEVGALTALEPSVPSDRATLQGADRGATTAHDHCSVVLAFRGSTPDRVVRESTRFVLPPAIVPSIDQPVPQPGRAIVLAGAPKTSPPAA
jgi:hypothetical protein